MFPFTRAQSNVRSLFGLGNAQLAGIDEVVRPVFDVNWALIHPQEQEVLTVVVAGVAPGANGLASGAPAGTGIFLVDFISLNTVGPVTSGSVTVNAAISRTRGATAGIQEALFDGERVLNRIAGANSIIGRSFLPPLLMFNTPNSSDSLNISLFNAAASVGNASLTAQMVFRRFPLTP